MKPPNLVGNLTGNAAVGFGDVRGMATIQTPFLTTAGPGYIARKKGDSSEVISLTTDKPTDPYLWGLFWAPGAGYTSTSIAATVKTVATNPELGTGADTSAEPPAGTTLEQGLGIWVGDDYVLMLGSATSFTAIGSHAPPLITNKTWWPVLMNPRNSTQGVPTDARPRSKSISFQSIADCNYYPRSIFSSGWKDEASRYVWGYSFIDYCSSSDTVVPQQTVTAPVVVVGNTGMLTTAATALPYEPSRAQQGGQVFCTGPGQLIAFFLVTEWLDPALPAGAKLIPKVLPFYCVSTDHGASWTRHDATFLDTYLRLFAVDVVHNYQRTHYDNAQLELIGNSIHVSYIGNGKSLIIVPSLVDSTTSDNLRAKLFLYDGGFTLLSWAADSWVDGSSLTLNTAREICSQSPSFCFGEGCLAVSVSGPGAISRILFTTDYGASWSSVTMPFYNHVLGAGITLAPPTVVAPYQGPLKRGRIIYTVNRGDGSGSDIWQTDGSFATFSKQASMFNNCAGDTPNVWPSLGAYQIPFLNRVKVRVDLPNEFNQP
jgi:hypothetical protein